MGDEAAPGLRTSTPTPPSRGVVRLRRTRRLARRSARAMLPDRVVWRLRGRRGPPPVGAVALGDLRRLSPISAVYGFDRGLPIDRHYIERFLARHAADIRGRVLEVGDDGYTRRFGGARVTTSTVLDVDDRNPQATLVADLAGAGLPSDAFDCIVLTQTLQLVFDVHAATRNLARMLARGGVLLLTVPGISQLEAADWCWAFTPYAVRRLLSGPYTDVRVDAHGNVLTASAFLTGLAADELTPGELDHHDPAYPMLITARAVRS